MVFSTMRNIATPQLLIAPGICLIFISLFLNAYAPRSSSFQTSEPGSVPILAYYYIWFDTKSWSRAKVDYPLLGRYSSDDADVMLQHVTWAKSAGIDGFIVSWKSTEKLNRRLEQLIKLAEQEDFKLAIIYEGLDFYRNPLSVDQVSADLDYFIEQHSKSEAFDLYEKPIMIWSGTWKFTREEIESVNQDRRDHLLILASEKNLEGYRRLSGLMDGNAYYWSSVNPDTHPGYSQKLNTLGEMIHSSGGLWIAPAAPGFDARLVGGTSVVERKNGETLRTQFSTALQSSPDAIGLISWNEFSENSHIEPSQNYGYRYLEVLAEMQRSNKEGVTDIPASHMPGNGMDSSVPGDTLMSLSFNQAAAFGLLAALLLISFWAILRRTRTNSGKSGM